MQSMPLLEKGRQPPVGASSFKNGEPTRSCLSRVDLLFAIFHIQISGTLIAHYISLIG